jgi:hypothetical protein
LPPVFLLFNADELFYPVSSPFAPGALFLESTSSSSIMYFFLFVGGADLFDFTDIKTNITIKVKLIE